MRTEIYNQLKTTVPDFVERYCARVPTSNVVYDKEQSQVRVAGHVTSNVKRFAEVMRHNPDALPPVSVVRDQADPARMKLKDGCTRHMAAEENGDDLFVCWYHDEVQSPSCEEWEELQMVFNDQPIGAPSSADDISKFLASQVDCGTMQHHVGHTYQSNPTGYIEAAAKYYQNLLSNAGKTKAWWKNKVKRALGGQIGISYEAYTPNQLLSWFKDATGFTGKRNGAVVNGEAAWAFTNPSHWNPNILGSLTAARQKLPEDNLQYTLIFAVGDLAGRTDEAVLKERETIRQSVIAFNKHARTILDGEDWFAAVYFAPQIKNGPNRESPRKLIKAEI